MGRQHTRLDPLVVWRRGVVVSLCFFGWWWAACLLLADPLSGIRQLSSQSFIIHAEVYVSGTRNDERPNYRINSNEKRFTGWLLPGMVGSAQPPLMVPPDGDGTNVSETAEPALAAGGRNIALLYLYFACFIPCSPSKFISQARPPTVVMY